jgi:hypothetical protein
VEQLCFDYSRDMTEQQWFEADVGTWDGEIAVQQQPGAPTQHSKGVMTHRLVGSWLVADFKNETGFEGHGIYGWDTAKQAYVGTWIDGLRRWLVVGTGTRKGQTITYRFELATGDRTMRWMDETERVDKNTRRFRALIELPTGELHAVVTGMYRRRS